MLTLIAACGTPIAPITRDGTVVGTGTYRLHLDDNDKAARPLVIVLGGLGQGVADIEKMTGANQLVDNGTKLTVAYAVSSSKSWNAGPVCCDPNRTNGVDDVATVDRLIAAIKTRMGARVDNRRIYVWGFSNGSTMAARYGCARVSVAAIGEVAAPLQVPCSYPVRMQHLHATDDQIIPLTGGTGCACFGPALGPWIDSRTEGSQLPAGSTWQLSTYTGNHVWPTNGTDQLWAFSSAYHL